MICSATYTTCNLLDQTTGCCQQQITSVLEVLPAWHIVFPSFLPLPLTPDKVVIASCNRQTQRDEQQQLDKARYAKAILNERAGAPNLQLTVISKCLAVRVTT